jgi:hypothetical protein
MDILQEHWTQKDLLLGLGQETLVLFFNNLHSQQLELSWVRGIVFFSCKIGHAGNTANAEKVWCSEHPEYQCEEQTYLAAKNPNTVFPWSSTVGVDSSNFLMHWLAQSNAISHTVPFPIQQLIGDHRKYGNS